MGNAVSQEIFFDLPIFEIIDLMFTNILNEWFWKKTTYRFT